MMTIALPIHRIAPERPGIEEEFDSRVQEESGYKELSSLSIDMVQVNIGLRCNLACHHCHVQSSPARKEEMSWDTMLLVLDAARRAGASTLDITGGAPEMHPRFREFVEAGLGQGLHVVVRTNLTIMLQPGYEDLPQFYATHGVHLMASLPCYLETNVDRQRGKHVYHDSIEVIKRLNAVGYGNDPRLQLGLVYNPGGPSLPPPQENLEEAYRRELLGRFGIRFNRLYTITNMPIGRFLHDLQRDGRAADYLQLLRDSFNSGTLPGLMCRNQLHVGWDGTMYDCDFNYALNLPVRGEHTHIRDFDPETFIGRRVRAGDHCFGCTAGCGSSCKGSLASFDLSR
jgi:radical SAM/Cys-rich protein